MGLDGDGITQQNLTESMIFCWGSYCLNGISMIFFAIQQNLTASFHEFGHEQSMQNMQNM
jgi:hypothetical protein